jgi:hypothetical protein
LLFNPEFHAIATHTDALVLGSVLVAISVTLMTWSPWESHIGSMLVARCYQAVLLNGRLIVIQNLQCSIIMISCNPSQMTCSLATGRPCSGSRGTATTHLNRSSRDGYPTSTAPPKKRPTLLKMRPRRGSW